MALADVFICNLNRLVLRFWAHTQNAERTQGLQQGKLCFQECHCFYLSCKIVAACLMCSIECQETISTGWWKMLYESVRRNFWSFAWSYVSLSISFPGFDGSGFKDRKLLRAGLLLSAEYDDRQERGRAMQGRSKTRRRSYNSGRFGAEQGMLVKSVQESHVVQQVQRVT